VRKVKPADVRAAFATEVDEILATFDRLATAAKGSSAGKRDISTLATNTFLALYVTFERFLSDLMLAYLNRDFSTYQALLVQRVAASIKDKFGVGVGSLVSLQSKRHVRVSELEGIVDPDGWNLTFSSVQKLKDTARDWLVPASAGRISTISTHEARLIQTARAVRDFIAHGSPASRATMNTLLATVEQGAHNRYLGRGTKDVQSVGVYLKAVLAGERRLHRYAGCLKFTASHI
jgi:hypothetical protein